MDPKTRSTGISKAQYMREYRANLSPSVKKERSRLRVEKARLRREALREKAKQDDLDLKRAQTDECTRQFRAKQYNLKRQQALSTPSTKAKHAAQLIDSASPSTSVCLESYHLKTSQEKTVTTRSASISKAQYMREYRANLSPSVKKERSRLRVEKARLRREALRAKAKQDYLDLKRARTAEYNRRYRAKKRTLKKQQALSLSLTKAERTAQLINSDSPSTNVCLESCHMKSSREKTK
ncbi:hypothetical protein EB796_008577 [Bugula neritina]|uniref:Uncharacterized protein n=1 Tax=Bugula neritina TaxID=10212 RepID=A0A7J7K4L7_BUGNE|nr:hypothetical protein EB796_008577 [Bugula neritina]